jgi:transmembrane sensor
MNKNKNQSNYKDVWDFTENPQEIQFDSKKAHADFLSKITVSKTQETPKTKVLSLRNFAVAAAAIFIGLVSFFVLSKNDLVNLSSNALATEYILPDNSKVIVYPNSSLSFNKTEFSKSRQVNLTGKALFDVTKSGQKFNITQGDVNIEVLGTTFIVSPSEVKVLEGTVNVSTPKGQKKVTTREKINIGSDVLTVEPANFSKEILSSETMSYDNEPIGKVISDIEVKFDVTILNPKKIELSNCSITATNLSKSSLEECLKVLNSAAGLNLSQDAKGSFSISSLSCN